MTLEEAFSADDDFVLAWVVAHGENNGGQFSFDAMTWRKREP